MKYKRELGSRVKPRSGNNIKREATKARSEFPDQDGPQIDLGAYLEFLGTKAGGEVVVEIVEDHELPGKLAETIPLQNLIRLKESVYEGAVDGNGFHRFTVAHEIGHLRLHREMPSYSWSVGTPTHEIFEDSEWQADEFAAAFLIDERFVTSDMGVDEIQKVFGVSEHAACLFLLKRSKKAA